MKTKILKLFAVVVVILVNVFVIPAIFAQETSDAAAAVILTVDEAVQAAMDNNLGLRRTALDLGTRKRAADRSWSGLLPSL